MKPSSNFKLYCDSIFYQFFLIKLWKQIREHIEREYDAMARFLLIATHGSEDPTRAGHALEFAVELATARQASLRTSAKLRAMPVHVIDLHSLTPSDGVW